MFLCVYVVSLQGSYMHRYFEKSGIILLRSGTGLT